MADPSSDDVDDDGTTDDAAAPAPRGKADPKADVEARRAATKARMDRSPATATADDPTGTKARRQAAAASKKVPRPSKRTGADVDAKAARSRAARSGDPRKAAEAAAESSRYTAPIPRSQIESPVWVPVIMFGLLAVGMIVIFLTYVLWEGRPLALGIGLGCILGGIIAATQYR